MKKPLLLLAALLSAHVTNAATVTNGGTVSMNGTFFTGESGWSLGTNAAPQDILKTDTLPEQTQWNFDSIWWNGYQNPSNAIVINLNGLFSILSFKIQADDNDSYIVSYKKNIADAWSTAWNVPIPGSWGLITSTTTLGAPIEARYLQVTATNGDGLYAVSRLNAEGRAIQTSHSVPDSASTLALLGLALGTLIVGVRSRR